MASETIQNIVSEMCEALEMFVNHASCLYHCDIHRFHPEITSCDGKFADGTDCPMKPECDAVFRGRAALAMPLRNCDVGTPEEQTCRYDAFCSEHRLPGVGCERCPIIKLKTAPSCELAWAQMPYKADEGDHLADTEKLRDALTRIATATSVWKKAEVEAETAIQHCHDIAMSALTTAERKGETNGSK